MTKEIKDMTIQEIKKDFYELLSEDETALLLEYLYTVAVGDVNSQEAQIYEIVRYYRNVKNRASTVTERIYKNTNEHLRTLFSQINVKDKKIATVGSSGDQALNAIYHGAKQVDLIDANILTRPFVELKIAAIKGLNYKEYLDFINNAENMPTEDYFKFYAKFSRKLPDDMRLFWDYVMLDENGISERTYQSIFYEDEVVIKNIGEFYDSLEFGKMKEILNGGDFKLNYIIAEFNDFPHKLKEKYDYILLSNIADYVYLDDFTHIATKLYLHNLNEGGNIQLTSAVRIRNEDTFNVLIAKSSAKGMQMEETGLYGDTSLFMQKPELTKYNKKEEFTTKR